MAVGIHRKRLTRVDPTNDRNRRKTVIDDGVAEDSRGSATSLGTNTLKQSFLLVLTLSEFEISLPRNRSGDSNGRV
jgi:hypothetical protein